MGSAMRQPAAVPARRVKKTPLSYQRGIRDKTLAMTYSRMVWTTLPSARLRFTSEFGMGSGGSTALISPGRRLERRHQRI